MSKNASKQKPELLLWSCDGSSYFANGQVVLDLAGVSQQSPAYDPPKENLHCGFCRGRWTVLMNIGTKLINRHIFTFIKWFTYPANLTDLLILLIWIFKSLNWQSTWTSPEFLHHQYSFISLIHLLLALFIHTSRDAETQPVGKPGW